SKKEEPFGAHAKRGLKSGKKRLRTALKPAPRGRTPWARRRRLSKGRYKRKASALRLRRKRRPRATSGFFYILSASSRLYTNLHYPAGNNSRPRGKCPLDTHVRACSAPAANPKYRTPGKRRYPYPVRYY